MKTQTTLPAFPSLSCAGPAALWCAAFVCALYPVNAYQLEFFMASLVLAYGWAVWMLVRGSQEGWTIPRAGVVVIAAAFWLLAFGSMFWSEIKPASLFGFSIFSMMPLTFLTLVLAGRDEFFLWCGRILLVVFGVLAVWAVIQFFFLNDYFDRQARHPLADPSSLGALFSLGFFAALGLAVSDRPKREIVAGGVVAALLLCGIAATVARGPAVALIPGLLVFGVLLWAQVRTHWRRVLLILAVGGIFTGAAPALTGETFNIQTRLSETIAMYNPDFTANRIDIWKATLRMIEDRPWLGTGIGTYYLYYPEYRAPNDLDATYNPHSDPLNFWAELGILGPVLFYGFILAAAVRTFRALSHIKTHGGSANRRVAIVASFAALAAMVVHSHVTFNHTNLSILMMNGLLLAFWFFATRLEKDSAHEKMATLPETFSTGARTALVGAPFVMFSWLIIGLCLGEFFVNRARDDLFSEQMFNFADNINRANSVSNGMSYRAYTFAVNVPMAILQNLTPSVDNDQRRALYDQITGYMDMVELLNPRESSAFYFRARAVELAGGEVLPENAPDPEALYLKALQLNPFHLGARMALHDLYVRKGRSIDAQIALLEEGRDLVYTVPQAGEFYQRLAALYLQNKDYDKAKATLVLYKNYEERSKESLKKQMTPLPSAFANPEW